MSPKFLLSVVSMVSLGAFLLIGEEPVALRVYTEAQASAGRAAYQSTCIKCHTETLMGRHGNPDEVPPLSSLPDDMQKVIKAAGGKVPALAGVGFLRRWSNRTTRDLSIRIGEAVGGFPPENRNDDTPLNITAYVLNANGAKAGTEALTSGTAAVIESVTKGVAQQSTPVSTR